MQPEHSRFVGYQLANGAHTESQHHGDFLRRVNGPALLIFWSHRRLECHRKARAQSLLNYMLIGALDAIPIGVMLLAELLNFFNRAALPMGAEFLFREKFEGLLSQDFEGVG